MAKLVYGIDMQYPSQAPEQHQKVSGLFSPFTERFQESPLTKVTFGSAAELAQGVPPTAKSPRSADVAFSVLRCNKQYSENGEAITFMGLIPSQNTFSTGQKSS